MWRAGNLPESSACPSAIDAYHKSTIISYDIGSAPSGAFHWWDIGSDGHVAMATTNGWAMMASCHVTESWGNCIGVTSVSGYSSSTGAKYLGWSYDYDKAEISDVHKPNPPPTPTVPRTATQDNGVPDTNYYKRQQIYVSVYSRNTLYFIYKYLLLKSVIICRPLTTATRALLTVCWAPTPGQARSAVWRTTATPGPLTECLVGILCSIHANRNSSNSRYTSIFSISGTNTYMAMQRLASHYGYTGPIDGALGPNSYRGIATYFNTL